MKAKYITKDLWQYVENSNKKSFKKIFDALTSDRFGVIVYDDTVFVETTCPSFDILPQYIYKFVDKWATKQGYKFSYVRN